MTKELQNSLTEIRGLIGNWNAGKIANEEELIDLLRPVVLKITEEIEKPQDGQQKIV